MYDKGRKKGTVRFAVRPGDDARDVSVVGDFSDWRPVAMKKQKDGTFVRNVPVARGTFEYKFIVDGRWVTDADRSQWSVSPLGTVNSVGTLE